MVQSERQEERIRGGTHTLVKVITECMPHMHTYKHTHTHMYKHMHTYIIYKCIYIFTGIHTHSHIQAYTYTYIHAPLTVHNM